MSDGDCAACSTPLMFDLLHANTTFTHTFFLSMRHDRRQSCGDDVDVVWPATKDLHRSVRYGGCMESKYSSYHDLWLAGRRSSCRLFNSRCIAVVLRPVSNQQRLRTLPLCLHLLQTLQRPVPRLMTRRKISIREQNAIVLSNTLRRLGESLLCILLRIVRPNPFRHLCHDL